MKLQEICRLDDGPIDFDFYRAQAIALRSEAMRDAFKRKVSLRYAVYTLAALLAAAIAAADPESLA